jgi:hypothetical protein
MGSACSTGVRELCPFPHSYAGSGRRLAHWRGTPRTPMNEHGADPLPPDTSSVTRRRRASPPPARRSSWPEQG